MSASFQQPFDGHESPGLKDILSSKGKEEILEFKMGRFSAELAEGLAEEDNLHEFMSGKLKLLVGYDPTDLEVLLTQKAPQERTDIIIGAAKAAVREALNNVEGIDIPLRIRYMPLIVDIGADGNQMDQFMVTNFNQRD